MDLMEIKNSGILELYVIGDLSEKERLEVEEAAANYPEILEEITEIEMALESYAFANASEVDPTAKPMLLAGINYTDRIQNGEIPVIPPTLSSNSKLSEFSVWLDRTDLQEPDEYDSMCGRIIGSNEEKTTMIIWLKEGAPPEVHTDEIEKFLIVEGSCEITIGSKVHALQTGDFLEIPLHISHSVKVTSPTRCKIILERHAA